MPDADGRIRPIAVPRVPWHEWREQRGYIDKPMDTAESVQADGTTKCSICGTTKCNCPE